MKRLRNLAAAAAIAGRLARVEELDAVKEPA